jgi:F-type H+-transporting ATPase subunit a
VANALEQFEIHPVGPLALNVGGMDLSFTNSALWMMVAVVVSTVFFTVAMRRRALVPSRLQAASEIAYEFIANMIRENIGTAGLQYFPLIFTIFMFVFLGNTLGLLPYAFTYTSHLIVNAAIALAIFLVVCVLGIARHGLHFFSLFLPPGVPWWMAPLIVVIEVISFLIRPVTLSVRLFANMMAGHILLKVIAGFAVGFLALGVGGLALGILPTLFNVLLIGFELLIAFLQAYVFTILACIYLKDTVDLHH